MSTKIESRRIKRKTDIATREYIWTVSIIEGLGSLMKGSFITDFVGIFVFQENGSLELGSLKETCWIVSIFKIFVNNSDKASFANKQMYTCILEFSIRFYVGLHFRSLFSIFLFIHF